MKTTVKVSCWLSTKVTYCNLAKLPRSSSLPSRRRALRKAHSVKELEDQGIGRPSTYATILSTIFTRAYVSKEEGRFHPTELGILITDLMESFPQVLDVAFTVHMETQLDDVEHGTVEWV